ncbi:prolyl oligopeptidase family serine peptidase [Chitinophaga horti]|uniref:Prolyl oligopeptidase family serine peptidase n=1 Tax=Chitinophaga horti TaxID=2920382 RepID=A0ABY6IYS3_9BACT|nr:prolyl oligopeptidase family serine peptidase [Chitinophaga horti]UYQ92413.1 prolyl oligopeptidase family serine peptidase [Chitinophaga horti]
MKKLVLSALLLVAVQAFAQDELKYQRPPAAIYDLAMAPATPAVSFNDKGTVMLLLGRSTYPTIEELSQPEYRLAGQRINPATFGQSRSSYYTNITITDPNTKKQSPVTGLPADARIGAISWSPSGKYFAFLVTGTNGITLWKADVAAKTATQVSRRKINTTIGNPIAWLSDDAILVQAVPVNMGAAPEKPLAAEGPTVQETKGKAAPAATYQDLLKNPYDEKLFDYYFQTELVVVGNGSEKVIAPAAVYTSVRPSPDKQYLLVNRLRKPYSYLVPAERFPTTIEIIKISGEKVKTLAENPLDEIRPTGFDATVSFPRSFNWRADVAATVVWVQALDGGDPRRKIAVRDEVKMLTAPFTGEAVSLARTTMRYRGLQWGNAQLALLSEGMRSLQKTKVSKIDPSNLAKEPVVLIDRSDNDRYNDPGDPVTVKSSFGTNVLYISPAKELLMTSEGASPQGDMPFIASFNLETRKQNILWRSAAPYYETPVEIIDPAKLLVITSRESVEDPANYFLRDIKRKKSTQLTSFTHPQPQLLGVQKQLLKYKRKDGVDLTAMLYLPKGYDPAKDGRLPVLMWAYPREYKSASDAAQVRGSQYRFTRVGYGSAIFWVTQGFAVMDATEMPIVGEGNREPNDNFIEQVVMNAEAAAEKITSMGVGDKNRLAVGGHSYGAFMTANLMAHTDIFKAGIARSGAYNRTLTPFGFQNEQRTYWQAPEVYYKMSPFSYADKIKEPLLMIHGEADNNSGTFPVQSERLYNAIKGNGGIARLVFLPQESHGYAAKESILHMLWEMDQWLTKYLKDAK